MNVMSNIGRSATLTVLSGVNSGAEERIGHRYLSLGGGEEDDLVLDDLPPAAARLRYVGGSVEVEATSVDITDAETRVGVGKTERFPLPVRLMLGDAVSLYLIETPGPHRTGSDHSGRWVWAGLAAGVALAVVLLALQLPGGSGGEEPIAAISDVAATEAVEEPSTGCSNCTAEAAAALRAALAETPLTGLKVVEDQGALRVTGSIPDYMDSLWMRVRVTYDSQWASDVPIIADVASSPAELPIVVSAVWLGEVPEIVAANNARYKIGDATAQGWIVDSIDADAIVLTRDGLRLVLDY